jgi:hypothetical protein
MYKMSGLTIEDELNPGEMPRDVQADDNIPLGDSPADRGGFDFSFLKAKTGEGTIDQYLDHPLNFNESRAIARVLRGASGLMGDLDFALVDIGIGVLDYVRGRRSHGIN